MVRQMENSKAGSVTGLNSGGVWLVGFGPFLFFVACLQWKSWGDRSVKASRVEVKKKKGSQERPRRGRWKKVLGLFSREQGGRDREETTELRLGVWEAAGSVW